MENVLYVVVISLHYQQRTTAAYICQHRDLFLFPSSAPSSPFSYPLSALQHLSPPTPESWYRHANPHQTTILPLSSFFVILWPPSQSCRSLSWSPQADPCPYSCLSCCSPSSESHIYLEFPACSENCIFHRYIKIFPASFSPSGIPHVRVSFFFHLLQLFRLFSSCPPPERGLFLTDLLLTSIRLPSTLSPLVEPFRRHHFWRCPQFCLTPFSTVVRMPSF